MKILIDRKFEVYSEDWGGQGFRPDIELINSFDTKEEAQNFIDKQKFKYTNLFIKNNDTIIKEFR